MMQDINLKKGYNMDNENEMHELVSNSMVLMDESQFNKNRYYQ